MVGNQQKVDIEIGDERYPIFYNLASPIKFENSKSNYGIQIADVLASSLTFALNHEEEPFSQYIIEQFEPFLSNRSILPDLQSVHPDERMTVVNGLVLLELVRRSKAGEDLVEGMGQFMSFAYHFGPQINASSLV